MAIELGRKMKTPLWNSLIYYSRFMDWFRAVLITVVNMAVQKLNVRKQFIINWVMKYFSHFRPVITLRVLIHIFCQRRVFILQNPILLLRLIFQPIVIVENLIENFVFLLILRANYEHNSTLTFIPCSAMTLGRFRLIIWYSIGRPVSIYTN